MKKYFTLLSFITIFFVCIQQTQAQESRVVEAEMPEAIAKKELHAINQAIELTGVQQRAVYKVLVDLQQNYKGLSANNDIATVNKAKAALLDKANGQLKNILNEEQFDYYMKSLEIKK